jgi:hypothetical protein
MVCPNCEGDITVQETINQPRATYRQRKCNVCGFKFFSKETICPSDEAQPLFTEWTRERSRKSRAKKKGLNYDVKFEDGRENKPEPKRPTSPLF